VTTEALAFEGPPPSALEAVVGARIVAARARVELAGVLIDQIDLATAVERIEGFLESGSAHQIMTVNLDFLSIAGRNRRFRETINRADLAVADGMPLVWGARLKGQPLPQRITGNELVEESCRLAARTGHGVFLLGGAPGVAEAAALRLQTRHQGLRITGVYSPPFGPLTSDEEERIVEMILRAAPGFLFVALGAPRQDLWIRSHLDQLNVPVAMGVGCVLDLLAGVVNRAPVLMQQTGLEWFYRLVHEPDRLWRRYFLNDMPMFGRLVWACMRDTHRDRMVPTPAAEPPA
jgi:N-acetylglucosaminyldiphosphoundecaprenol N-acetyl-beta-D-mannosaminyltransferase